MKRFITVLTFIVAMTINSYASDVCIDGIYYNLYPETKEASVTYMSDIGNSYSGNVVIPSSIVCNNTEYTVTIIEENAFEGCINLFSILIPNSVTTIEDAAFSGCTGLSSLSIGNNVKSIGESAFQYCSGLSSVVIPNSVTKMGEKAFRRCSGLISVTISSSMKSISDEAFEDCTSLASITIPNSITSIGNETFWGCNQISNIDLPNSVTRIGEGAFAHCSGLTSITIPNSITSIGNETFWGCNQISNIDLPNSVTRIGEDAFRNCSGLKSVSIPNSVNTIRSGAFEGCSRLKDIIVSCEDETDFCKYIQRTDIFTVFYSNGLNDKNHHIYLNGEKQTSLIIPNSIRCIGDFAFAYNPELITITLPHSLTGICKDAFKECVCLTSIIVSCKDEIEFANYVQREDLFSVFYASELEDKEHSISIAGEKKTAIIFPDNVTKVGEYAFKNNSCITSVTIPESVKEFQKSSFEDCSNVKDLIFTDGTKNIQRTYITSITTVTIPNSVTTIDKEAFNNCDNLGKVIVACKDEADFANYVKREDIFSVFHPEALWRTTYSIQIGGEEKTSIVIPNSVVNIGESAFQYCSGLSSVVIPNSVTNIGDYAFFGCYSLKEVVLGESLNNIGNQAFQFADIETIRSLNPIPPICANDYIFSSRTYSTASLVVPNKQNALALYKADSIWSQFLDIKVDNITDIDSITTGTANKNEGVHTIYGLKFNITNRSNGIVIKNGKKYITK